VCKSQDLLSLHSRCRCVQGEVTFGLLCPPSARESRLPIPRLSRGPSLLDSSFPSLPTPDRLLRHGEQAKSYSVPDGRLSLRVGRHSTPGGCGGERWRRFESDSPEAACTDSSSVSFWTQPVNRFGWLAMTTLGCLHGRCPCVTVLGGILRSVRSYRLLSHAPPRGVGHSP
jgi:hypothetical protein